MSANIAKLTPSGLAALLCARICHDLISPVGALSTALEILDDESNVDMHADAMDLVRNSSRQANAKLKFLRLAFGAGGSAPGVIGVEELQTLAGDMYAGGKASLTWALTDDGLDKNHARILLNLIMLAVQAIPRGGDVNIGQNGSTLVLTATGPRARLDAAVERTLVGKAPEDGFDGRSIQPFYTGMMARELGGKAIAAITDETVTFTADLPAAK
ncbi:histidine phosphotransferase ChpT [Litorimonas sp. RW-G-Af-16]|uniref:histidine phosphotransferase ChpT n=1 Tax=Litorimonas sp. RW-G-Af-16 TaxID=3241168 RepID=UPI00390C8177